MSIRCILSLAIALLCVSSLPAQEPTPEPPPIEGTVSPSTEAEVAEPEEPATPDIEPAEAPPSEAPPEERVVPDLAPQPLLTGDLPWADTVKPTKKLPTQRLRSAMQMLEMFGLDESQWLRLEDGRPLVDSEHELLYKILFRTPRFLLEDIERWQHYDPNWSEVAAEIEANRGDMFLLKGTATQVDKIDMIEELATLYEFDHYFRVAVKLADGRAAEVYTRRVPAKWPVGETIDQRIQVSALLLKVGEPPADGTPDPLVFVAQRVAWFPKSASKELAVTKDRLMLSALGMDLALLDDIPQRTGVGSRDRESFYQMVHALRHANAEELAAAAEKESEVIPLFQSPEEQTGELMTFVGTARRITKVECDPDIRRRIGLSHYYQIDVFIPLDNERIRLGRKEDSEPGEESPVFTNNYPFTLCVANLPKGMEEKQELNQSIRFTAFFFKLWTYKTVYMNQFGTERKQIGPMLIGKSFSLTEPPTWPLRPYLGTIFGVLFVGALGTIWFSVWRNSKADTDFQRNTLSKSYETPGGPSLNEMGIEESGDPDFSDWGDAGPKQ